MNVPTVFSRRAAGRAERPTTDHTAALVIALMMALVFAPIIGLHVASVMLDVDTPTKTAPAPGLATAPISKHAPG